MQTCYFFRGFQWDATDEASGPVRFGGADWQPVVGDWNGDGIDDVGIYRDGMWWRDVNGSSRWDATDESIPVYFGGAGWTPVAGNWVADPDVSDLLQRTGSRYRAVALEPFAGQNVDVSALLEQCIDAVPVGATLELPAGEYRISHRVDVDRRIVLTSVGKSLDDPVVTAGSGEAAEWRPRKMREP